MCRAKIILLCFVFLAVSCWDDLTIQMEGEAKIQTRPGEALNLTCHVNYGVHLLLRYTVEWRIQSLWDSNSTSVELSDYHRQSGITSGEGYHLILLDHFRGGTRTVLLFNNVTSEDDGIFSCCLKPVGAVGDLMNASKEVTVVNDVQNVTLTFDGVEAVTGQNNTPVKKEEGVYNITCTAQGFSPSASIRIFLGEEEQTTGDVVSTLDGVASLEAKSRRYTATVTATAVRICADHEGKELRCDAKANFESYLPSAELIVASVSLNIVSHSDQDNREKLQSHSGKTENSMALWLGVAGGLVVLIIVIVVVIIVIVRRRATAEGNTSAYLRIRPSSRTDVSMDDVMDDVVTFHSKAPPETEHNGKSEENHEAAISSGS